MGRCPALAGDITLGHAIATPSHLAGRANEERAARVSAAWGPRTISISATPTAQARSGTVGASAHPVILPIRGTRHMRHARAKSLPLADLRVQHSLRRDAVQAMADSILKAISLHQFVFSRISAPRFILITDR